MKLLNRISLVVVAVASLLTGLAQALVITDDDDGKPSDGKRKVSAELFSDLEELARLVDISYCVGSTGVYNPFKCLSHCDEFEGFELVTTWNTGPLLSDSCGYIALSHAPYAKRIIVAFRGTYSLTNTIVDLSTVPQEYVPYPGDGDDDDDDDEIFLASDAATQKCNNCTVHSGFWSSWKNSRSSILPEILRAKQENPEYQLVLVGHSLGGAVAALAGLEMSLRGLDPHVTTFGEPKVGNAGFSEVINAAFSSPSSLQTTSDSNNNKDMRYRRVTHVNDPVPLLPLKEWGYTSHSGEIYISKLSLPPSLHDLEVCEGNEDERCIAGAETAESLEHMATQTAESPVIQVQHENEMQTQMSLIPAKYRLWELFFSHRDYFWRIGLCVPGGDPGSWRW